MQNNQTICFLNTVKTWGGGEKWHLDIATHLHSIGWSIILYVSPQSELANRAQIQKLPIREVEIGKYSFVNPLKVMRLREYYQTDRVDTVIMNLSSDMKIGALAANNGRVRRIIYRRGSAIPIKNSWINQIILKNHVTEILANSQATVESIFENNQNIFDQNQVTVIPNGIDIPALEKLNQKKPSLPLRIGNVGRLYKQKAQHYLIDLAIELKSTQHNFVIEIVGDGVDHHKLSSLIKENNLENEVKLLGFKQDIEEFYQSLDVFVLTSVWEGFGYVLAEAMSYGVPAVAFNISSNPELITHGINGHLVPLGDIRAIALSIDTIMKDRQRYSNAARQKVEREYAKANILSKIESYLIDKKE